MDARERAAAETMFTSLPADLIERVRQFGIAEHLSRSAVIERAIRTMFAERSDETLGDTLHNARYRESRIHVTSDAHELTLHELLEEHFP